MKVVINACHGGFGLSDKAEELYKRAKGITGKDTYCVSWDVPRDDPDLVRIVEQLGTKADTSFSQLKIIDIPDGVEFQIEEYDGLEWVAEKHRTWR